MTDPVSCAAKLKAMQDAILAFDTSVLALQQLQAVVASNAAAVMSTTMDYTTHCIPAPPGGEPMAPLKELIFNPMGTALSVVEFQVKVMKALHEKYMKELKTQVKLDDK